MRTACEWKVCDACAETCAHEYKPGIVHGGGIDIGVQRFCGRCGRVEPLATGEQELPLDVHHALAAAHLERNGIGCVFLPPPSNDQ